MKGDTPTLYWKAQYEASGARSWKDLENRLYENRLEAVYTAREQIAWNPVRAVPVPANRGARKSRRGEIESETEIVDVAVVGAGAAGLKAALEAGIDGLKTILIEAELLAGGRAGMLGSNELDFEGSGRQLTSSALEKAVHWGAIPRLGAAVRLLDYNAETGIKTLSLSDGVILAARTVIIATGERYQQQQFPGSDSRSVIYGDEEKLTADCEGKAVVVFGGSDAAGTAALGASYGDADHVYVLSERTISRDHDLANTMAYTPESMLRRIPNVTIIEEDGIGALHLDRDGNATSLITTRGLEIPCHALGIFVGLTPNTEWLPDEIERDDRGSILVGPQRVIRDVFIKDENDKLVPLLEDGHQVRSVDVIRPNAQSYETSMPGVFAVGAVRHDGASNVAVAFADGTNAEGNVVRHIAASMAREGNEFFKQWVKRRAQQAEW